MFKKFTDHARKVMIIARQEAQRLNSEVIGTEHILLAIFQDGRSIAAKALQDMSIDFRRIRTEIEWLVTPNTSPTVTLGQIPLSPRAVRVVELAGATANALSHEFIAPEHLLLGILEEAENVAAQVFGSMGFQLNDVRVKVLGELGIDPPPKIEEEPTQLSTTVR